MVRTKAQNMGWQRAPPKAGVFPHPLPALTALTPTPTAPEDPSCTRPSPVPLV